MRSEQQRHQQSQADDPSSGSWQGYPWPLSSDEEKEKTNLHYEQPVEFFTEVVGGSWHTYSCNLWEGASSETESQERKLDLLARLMHLQPGQRILDVGSGWGGPLVYLAKQYDVTGVGLTLSPTQRAYAESRARAHEVDAQFYECHWRDFEDGQPYDVVFTDEVIVHFQDLLSYFERVKALLRPGGVMLNKEVHFASSRFLRSTPGGIVISEVFEESGSYRMLHDELMLADQAGFAVERLQQIPLVNYQKTIESWSSNMRRARAELEHLVGTDYYKRFLTYLRMGRRIVSGPWMTLDVVVARSPA